MNPFDILTGNQSSLIPERDTNAISGSSFIQKNINFKSGIREDRILQEFLSGNIPNFLRKFIPITVTDGTDSIVYLVMPDYLSIGSDSDYVRMPTNPLTAQKIADKYDCTLPTRKMVNDIWKHSDNKLEPLPWGPPYDDSMSYTERFGIHNSRIQNQLSDKNPFLLTSGHKKDIVLTNKLTPNNPNKRVAIYGWIHTNGQAIQGLNHVSHDDKYSDYAHGTRLISNDVLVNGTLTKIQHIFSDASLAHLVSDEGPLTFQNY